MAGSGLKKSIGSSLAMDGKWAEVSELASQSLLPRIDDPMNGEFELKVSKFFTVQKVLIGKNLQEILILLRNIPQSQAAMRKHIIPLFLLLGEQEDGQQLWSSPPNEDKVSLIIQELYRIFQMEMQSSGPLAAFFLRDFESITNPLKTTFAHLLKSFRNTLGTKEAEWKKYPGAQHSFQWLIFQVKYPYLTEHIEGSLLPTLNFFDDFEEKNILFGINCLSHILDNVVKADLKHSGWGSLVHDHLKKAVMFQKQGQIIDKIMPELLKVLKIIEIDPHVHSDQFTLYDSSLESLLFTVQTADAVTKCIWLKHLTTFFDVMGNATLHWIDRIIEILMDLTVCVDPPRWLYILKCVKVCIANTWVRPQSEAFAEIILRITFNAVVLSAHMTADAGSMTEISQVAVECVKALQKNEDFPRLKEEILTLQKSGKGKFLPKFLETCEFLFSNT